jgi:hypothetical protein
LAFGLPLLYVADAGVFKIINVRLRLLPGEESPTTIFGSISHLSIHIPDLLAIYGNVVGGETPTRSDGKGLDFI